MVLEVANAYQINNILMMKVKNVLIFLLPLQDSEIIKKETQLKNVDWLTENQSVQYVKVLPLHNAQLVLMDSIWIKVNKNAQNVPQDVIIVKQQLLVMNANQDSKHLIMQMDNI